VAAGAVVFRIEAVVGVFLTAIEAVCIREVGLFVAAAAADAVVGFLAPVPVRVDLVIVVPEDAVDPVLFLRSPCRVAGRGKGDRIVLGPVAARVVVLWFCTGGRVSFTADTVWPRDRNGLDGFNGEVGRARYEG
jgi:hypothetical protein